MVPRLWKSLWGLPSSLPTWFPCPHPQVSASKLQPPSGLAPDVSSTLWTLFCHLESCPALRCSDAARQILREEGKELKINHLESSIF